jgi:hypothetical protein
MLLFMQGSANSSSPSPVLNLTTMKSTKIQFLIFLVTVNYM